jgi:hypothetical protein
VGAGLLAKVVNDDAGILIQRGVLRFSPASRLRQKSGSAFASNTQVGFQAAVLLLLILGAPPTGGAERFGYFAAFLQSDSL